MAHPCIQCGGECYCKGDWDDIIVCNTPSSCEGCGCEEMFDDEDDYDDNGFWSEGEEGEPVFDPCSKCDGHDACADFGCAIKHGIKIKGIEELYYDTN